MYENYNPIQADSKIKSYPGAADDWFRNINWDKCIEEGFEAKLKRSRGSFHKAQYLRIQASYLLGSRDDKIQVIGIQLMERLIADFPNEEFSTPYGREQLGDYYLEKGQLAKAEYYYRIVTEFYNKKKTRSGTSGIADLKLAKAIFSTNNKEKFEEAYQLCTAFPISDITFNSERFDFYKLIAEICISLGKKEEAKEYASIAIEISKITEPQFSRHKTIGLIQTTEKELQMLQRIAND